jgi:hypothetical protein
MLLKFVHLKAGKIICKTTISKNSAFLLFIRQKKTALTGSFFVFKKLNAQNGRGLSSKIKKLFNRK